MTAHLVVFGREPVAGATKTRLAAAIGGEAAARVASALLEHTLAAAALTRLPVVLSLAAAPSPDWSARLSTPWEVQCAGGLGSRMRDAFDRRFAAGATAVVVVGSDCPTVTPDLLLSAFAALEGVPVVLGPATDGGYWCVGQRAPGVDLFEGVPFSARSTLRRTRDRLRRLRVAWAEIATLRDVDTEADLAAALERPGLEPDVARRLRDAADG